VLRPGRELLRDVGQDIQGAGRPDARLANREAAAAEIGHDHHTVYVWPELVVEIAYNDLQASTHYPGGLALRFARGKAYCPDKRPEEADCATHFQFQPYYLTLLKISMLH
jgi:ATP-dependent DNA ligase